LFFQCDGRIENFARRGHRGWMIASAFPRGKEGALRDFKTGTGFAYAKLSEILPAARAARYVRMTECDARCGQDARGAGLERRRASRRLIAIRASIAKGTVATA
jgi:hypothetical protein